MAIGSGVAGVSFAVLAFAWHGGFATHELVPPERLPVRETALFVPVKQYQPIGTAPRDPANLVRAIQNELTRVGCYSGPVDGIWSKPTRAAMSAFTDRANARLPVDRPDDALLSLVKGSKPGPCAETVAATVAAPVSTAGVPPTRQSSLPAPSIPPALVDPLKNAAKDVPKDAPKDAYVRPVARDLKPMPGGLATPADKKLAAAAAGPVSAAATEFVSFGSGVNVAAASRASDQDDLQDSPRVSAVRPPPVVVERADGPPPSVAPSVAPSVPPVTVQSLEDRPAASKPVASKAAKSAKRTLSRSVTAARPSSPSKQPKFVKSLMRSVKSTLASFGIN